MNETPSHATPKAAPFLWRDGNLVPWSEATIHVTAVGHASVSAVFEGIKAHWNASRNELYVLALPEHMKRLRQSVRLSRLRFDWSVPELVDATLTLLRANETRTDTYIRPWVFASGIIRELIVQPNAPTETAIDTWPFTTSIGTGRTVRATVSSWRRISESVMPPRVKTFSNYHNSRLAVADAKHAGYDAPIFLNEHNRVSESAGACIALVFGDTLVTPSLSSSILPSITRDVVMDVARHIGMTVVERDVDRTELYIADEAFFMGTGWEILPITEIDGYALGMSATGPKTRALQDAYVSAVRGENPAFTRYLTPVWSPAPVASPGAGA